jgi:hypothetical protein
MSKTIHKVTMELSIYLDEGTSDGCYKMDQSRR